MKLLYSWLKDFIDLNLTPEELTKHFTSLGMEVADLKKTGADFDGVYAAKIEHIENHPNSDHLHLVDLTTKDGAQRVVCGAQNIAVGQIVPLAKVGARLGQIVLKPAVIRGVTSEGMLCSADELGLASTRQKGILILDSSVKVGADIKALYGGEADYIFDLELTPNRPDLMSVLGIARELATLLNLPLKNKIYAEVKGEGKSLEINLPCGSDGCQRYMGRIIRNVKNVPSPKWLQDRLLALGVNPKNALVDITNYVMFELGQPLHAFDLSRIEGGQINVRFASEGEEFLGLDDIKRILTPQTLVICDDKKPLCLAGILGGKEDSILDTTKDIFLEAANFNPVCINKTSKKFALSSESSQRFERGLDIEGPALAMQAASALVLEICGGEASEVNDVYPQKIETPEVTFTLKQIEDILGMQIPQEKAEQILRSLGSLIVGEKWVFKANSYRRDLKHRWDIAEELARYYGLENLAPQITSTHATLYFAEHPKTIDIGEIFAQKLVGLGFFECKNIALTSKQDVENFGFTTAQVPEIANPLAEGLEFLRPSLLASLLKNLEYNQRFSNNDLCLFEYDKTFSLQKGYPTEGFALAGVMTGKTPREKFFLTPQCQVGFYGLKGVVTNLLGDFAYTLQPAKQAPKYMHPKICMEIIVDKKVIGYLGELHPLTLKQYDVKQAVYAFEFNIKNLEKQFSAAEFKKAKEVSVLPSAWRDLSFITDEKISYAEILDALKEVPAKISLIDLYQGPNLPQGKKSLTLRFEFTAKEKTLTDKEVSNFIEGIFKTLQAKFGAALR